MQDKIYETIIIGGGMAGIGCARTLSSKQKDFLLISKDIGGRVICSPDGEVNYGAFYVRKDYRQVLPFVHIGRKISFGSVRFQRGNKSWNFWDVVYKHPFAVLKLYAHLLLFNFHYQKFEKNSQKTDQIELLEKDPYLKKMHAIRANDFLMLHNLKILTPLLIDPLVKSTAFLDVEEMPLSAAGLLLLLLIGLYPTYEFKLNKDALVAGLADNIIDDEVVSITRQEDVWTVKTILGNEYNAKNLVAATPIDITKRLLQLDLPVNHSISVHMAHVAGELLPEYNESGNFILFSSHKTQDIVISKEPNNSYLFYSHNPNYDLSKYFKNYEIITEKFWHPAFFIGHKFIPCRFAHDLFIIGDHNIVGMEDAYITGIYAANQIIGHNSYTGLAL